MKTIVASVHPDLSREFDQELLRRSDVRLVTVRTVGELIERLRMGADLCLVGRLLADGSGASACAAARADKRTALIPVVLILGPGASPFAGASPVDRPQRSTATLSGNLPRSAASLGAGASRAGADFDDVLELPAPPGALSLLLARFLGVPLREGERFPVRVHVFSEAPAEGQGAPIDGPPPDQYLGTTVDLSELGLLLKTRRTLQIDERLALRFKLPGQHTDLDVQAKVVRLDPHSFAPDHGVGCSFESLTEFDRRALREYLGTLLLARPFRWHVVREQNRQVISLTGVLRADADLTPLRQLRGELDFRLHDFRRVSSDSIQTWLDLIRSLTGASKIRLLECPIAFVQQANAISNLLEQTQVVSFYAPYMCPRCGLDEERLIDVARDLPVAPPDDKGDKGARARRPPSFPCTSCGAPLVFDDIPERYFAFL